MNPKTRDHIAVAAGAAVVYWALHQEKQAKMTILAAVGGATVLWMIHRWENAEN